MASNRHRLVLPRRSWGGGKLRSALGLTTCGHPRRGVVTQRDWEWCSFTGAPQPIAAQAMAQRATAQAQQLFRLYHIAARLS